MGKKDAEKNIWSSNRKLNVEDPHQSKADESV
jgi:hypothetical protein